MTGKRTRPAEIQRLRERLREAEETLEAIRSGAVDALVVSGPDGERVFTLEGADRPYRVLVEEMAEPALVLTRDGCIRYSNLRLAEMLHVPLQSLLGQSLMPFVSERCRGHLSDVLAQPLPGRMDLRAMLYPADGSHVHARIAVREMPGTERLISAVVTDLTEERRAERARVLMREVTATADEIATIDEGLESLVRKICDATGWALGEIWRPSADGTALELTGRWDDTGAVPGHFDRLDGSGRCARGTGLAGRAWVTGEPAVELDGARLAQSRSVAPFTARRAIAIPVPCGGGPVAVLMFYCARDREDAPKLRELAIGAISQFALVWQRRSAERQLVLQAEELRRSNEELEQFAYIVSHDLQEPLRTMVRYVQLLEQRYGEAVDHVGREYIAFAVSGAHRMSELLTAILEYSRVTRKGEPPREVDSTEVAHAAIQQLARVIEQSGARITVGSLPVVRADEAQLLQVFQNLFANALKFRGASPPEVRVAAERSGGEWAFTVADNGIGVPEEAHVRVFDMFQRAHRSAGYPGAGVGLAVCKRVIDRHRGRMWVESDGVHGSRFCFTLPDAR